MATNNGSRTMDLVGTDAGEIERILSRVDQRLDDLRTELEEALWELHGYCESPIERIMATRLLFANCGYSKNGHWNRVWPYGLSAGPTPGPKLEDRDIIIAPQEQIGAFRVDFVLLFQAGEKCARYVIECDGHDFHERTKEQAARDKKRDRILQSAGYQVFRYTGSEIWRNADDLLSELERSLCDFIEEAWGLPRRRQP